jgi:hypothetical protein
MMRHSPFIVFVVSLVIFFASTENLIATVRFPTGDEPYYLLIAHSLVYDHDFELTNNFAREDYRLFYPGDLFPRHEAVTPKPILVSKHSLGLPLLIAPAYAFDGWSGAAHTLNLFGALLAVNLFLLARELSGSERAAWATWLALAFAVPFFTYSELIFPEVPAALLIAYAYRHLRAWSTASRAQQFAVALCLAGLPWLHARFLFVVAGLALYLLANIWWDYRRSGRRPESLWQQGLDVLRRSAVLWIPLLVAAVLFTAYNVYVYDSPLPNYSDHSGSGVPAEFVAAFFGVWLDQQWGLLNHAPVYLLALGALALAAWRRETAADGGRRTLERAAAEVPQASTTRRLLAVTRGQLTTYSRSRLAWPLLTTVPYFILIVQYRYWWGEWCPPARYLTPILPLLAGPLALALARIHTVRFRVTFLALGAIGWTVALLFAVDGRLMYNQPLGKSMLLGLLGRRLGTDLTGLEPSYIMMFLKEFDPLRWAADQTVLTIVWLAALGVTACVAFGVQPWRARSRQIALSVPHIEA